MENVNNNVIVSIRAHEIYQHPDNPRKDLGDLSELSASISKKGIMQNLTVIPGHWDENRRWHEEGYTLIIGHRRFAAAKLAGVAELPCRVVDNMDKRDQVSTMLEENMQRVDLTICEQANGFQMMLDLGETEEQIAKKTGFSKTTVRRRLNIAKLDQKILREKESSDSFQLSLKDLYELEKVEDIATRNKILAEANSSRDIVWKAQNAVTNAARDKRRAVICKMMYEDGIKKAPEKAEQEMYSGKWETVKEYDLDKEVPKNLRIPKKDKEKLYYLVYYGRAIRLIKKTPTKMETPEEKARKEVEKRKKQIRAVLKEMDIRKKEFIGNVISGEIAPLKETEEVVEEMWHVIVGMGTYVSMSSLRRFFTGKQDYECNLEEKEEANSKIFGLKLEYQMMIAMSYVLENADVYDYQLHHNTERCEKIKRAYAVLERYGWFFTDEEKEILDGTHEFYVPEEKKEGKSNEAGNIE